MLRAGMNTSVRARRSITGRLEHFVEGRHLPFLTASHDILGLPTVNGDVAFRLMKLARRKGHVLYFRRSNAQRRDPVVGRVKRVCVMRGGSLTTCLHRLKGVKRSPRSCTSV